MSAYDFVVKQYEKPNLSNSPYVYELNVEKMPLDGNRLPLLDTWLAKEDIPDSERGHVIEQLEGLPTRMQSVTVEGRSGLIKIRSLE